MGRLTEYFGSGQGRRTYFIDRRPAVNRSASGNGVITAEVNMDAVRQHIDDLGKMLTSNDGTYKDLQNIIRKEIKKTRNQIAKDVKANLGQDPKNAYRAVRSTIYKQVLGGNINILAKRKAGRLVAPPIQDGDSIRWGGNRRKRSPRTEKLLSYTGADRGFILRFNNSGAAERHIKFTLAKRKEDKWNHNPNTGNRGNIAPRGVFAHSAVFRFEETLANIDKVMEEYFNEIWEEN